MSDTFFSVQISLQATRSIVDIAYTLDYIADPCSIMGL